ncbi:MAG TPA: DUF1553 domain-containing protein [Chthonomonadaceae bacterium]|nr:DUF1553 domain-containing protein [Chthonomonadaceae bacterium]
MTVAKYGAFWSATLCVLASGIAAGAQPQSPIRIVQTDAALNDAQARQRPLAAMRTVHSFAGDRSLDAVFASSNRKVAGALAISRCSAGARSKFATAPIQNLHARGSGRSKYQTPVSFRNHVLPVLTKAGCNSGACHGAAAGKGGLNLSLRGFDPDADYNVLTRQAGGRRVVPGDPASSLCLRKPTMALPHGGGLRIAPGSPEYRVLASWIVAGAPRPSPRDARVQALEVSPARAAIPLHATQQITVRARYSDGHSEDVTRWVKFGSSDNSVATVDDMGRAEMAGSGEAAITAWFNSKVTFARLTSRFAGAPPPEVYAQAPRAGFIDDLVLAKLKALGIAPSSRCSDSEFVRRAFLDSAGDLPTPGETRAFLADTAPDRRAKLIDRLLARPECVDYWTYKWCDLFLVSSKKLPAPAMKVFYDYLRKSVADDKPWDQLAREILTPTGSNLDNGAASYYVMHKDPIDLTETTTQAFLGMPLTCARCHNHPLEKWTQRDYYQMANLFSRVRLKNGDRAGEVLVLASDEGNINLPRLGAPLPPRPLDGEEIALDDPADRRQKLADWMTSPANPYFAKAIVNRVWRSLMGRGLVESEDDVRLTNPPSNADLLDALTADFVRGGFHIRRLIREIMLSETYQRSSAPAGNNGGDDRYYSRYVVRRLPAEVILDSLSQVTGIPTDFAGYPKGTRALQLPDSQVASYFLTAFGRPERERTCACERQQEPNVAQALHLANGDTVNAKLRAPGGLIDALLKSGATDDRVLDDVYLAAFCRLPTTDERSKALAILRDSAGPDRGRPFPDPTARRAVLEDVCWAVLTGREFLFNH